MLQSKPNDASATLQLASVYFSMGRLDEAQKGFAKAVELNPNDADGWAGLGLMLQRIADTKKLWPPSKGLSPLIPNCSRLDLLLASPP